MADYEIGSMRDMEHDIRTLITLARYRYPDDEAIDKIEKKYNKIVEEWNKS